MRCESKPINKSLLINTDKKVENLPSSLQAMSLNSLNQSATNGDLNVNHRFNQDDDGMKIFYIMFLFKRVFCMNQ